MKTAQIIKGIIILLFAIVAFTACEDVVEVELNDEDIDLIAVEAYISTKAENNVYVKLERTLAVNQTAQNPVISNAVVQISDNADSPNTVTLEEQGTTGIYMLPAGTNYPGVTGRTYTLTITTPDGTVITGEEYLQEVETLDTVKVNLSDRGNYEYLGIYINSQETPGLGHYYKWDIYLNGELLNDGEDLAFASDELVDGNYIYDMLVLLDWEDEEEDKILHLGDTVVVEQLSISEAAYEFYWGLSDQAWAGGPFSVPPANVPSNLTSSDGKRILGLFSARDISVGNTVIIDDSNFTPLVSSVPEI
ncbi:DUF4249 domain-containing protein [Draconibacterium sediminis]|uniref:DUF4249 domain-containing protein n=1 Tax=Draconibacterium sediminis TaxID=1544798 RepID=A0A0D8JES0_9BACT|nr:DUF4249 domain-containing protein [Draconibacterium sediminis]KJF45405.1 hypothetical protein LH29_08575 [Draconibacterium sediminis]